MIRIVIPGLSERSGVVRLVTIASPDTRIWPVFSSSLIRTRVPTGFGSWEGTKIPLATYFGAKRSRKSRSSEHGIFTR